MNDSPRQRQNPATGVLIALLALAVTALILVGFFVIRSVTDDPKGEPAMASMPSATVPPSTTKTVAAVQPPSASSVSTRVVKILASESLGTGFLYEVRGLDAFFVTNAHVVGTEPQVTVVGSDGEEHSADVWTIDESRDIAVLRVEGISSIEPLPTGDSDDLELGDEIVVIGYALGDQLLGDPSLSRGILSGRRLIDDVDYLQTDAAMNPGNSGGPVINDVGEVVGIATWGIRDSNGIVIEGIGFAIPIDEVGSIPESPQTRSSNSGIALPSTQPTATRPTVPTSPPVRENPPTATPTTSNLWPPIHIVEFNDEDQGSLQFWSGDLERFRFENGHLRVSLPPGDTEYFWTYSRRSADLQSGSVSARVFIDGTDGAGVMARATVDTDGNLVRDYECLIRAAHGTRGFGCYRRSDYERTMLASEDSDAVVIGAWNVIELIVTDRELTFFINGQRVFAWSDPDPLVPGYWGLHLRRYDGTVGSVILCDRMVISERR